MVSRTCSRLIPPHLPINSVGLIFNDWTFIGLQERVDIKRNLQVSTSQGFGARNLHLKCESSMVVVTKHVCHTWTKTPERGAGYLSDTFGTLAAENTML